MDNQIDPQEKLRQLENLRNDLLQRKARLDVVRDQATRTLQECEVEMQELGTTPATIAEDLARLEREESTKLQDDERKLQQYQEQLAQREAELQALRNPTPAANARRTTTGALA
jgi:ornithine carbamoyltransferase